MCMVLMGKIISTAKIKNNDVVLAGVCTKQVCALMSREHQNASSIMVGCDTFDLFYDLDIALIVILVMF